MLSIYLHTKCVSLNMFPCDFVGRFIEQQGGGNNNLT